MQKTDKIEEPIIQLKALQTDSTEFQGHYGRAGAPTKRTMERENLPLNIQDYNLNYSLNLS